MVKVTIVTEDASIDELIANFKFTEESIVGVKYSAEFLFNPLSLNAISQIIVGSNITIMDTGIMSGDLLYSGVAREVSTELKKGTRMTKVVLFDEIFATLVDTTFTGELRGELSNVLTILLNQHDIKVRKNYTGNVLVDKYYNGHLIHILKDISRQFGVYWNIKNKQLELGFTENDRTIDVDQQEVNLVTSMYTRREQRFLGESGSVPRSVAIKAGTRIRIGKLEYIVGKIKRERVATKAAIVDQTNVVLIKKVADVATFFEVFDDEHDTIDLIDFNKLQLAYDRDRDQVMFYDPKIGRWVGDSTVLTFFTNSTITAGTYFYISGGLQGSASIGYYVPRDVFISDITFVHSHVGAFSEGFIEICRNGVVIRRVDHGALLTTDVRLNDIFAGNAVLSIRNAVGSVSITKALIAIRIKELGGNLSEL